MRYRLEPKYDNRKDFYGKAEVERDERGDTLISYGTEICTITPDGEIVKLWDDWSQTTGRHLNDFLQQAGFPPTNKKEWLSM